MTVLVEKQGMSAPTCQNLNFASYWDQIKGISSFNPCEDTLSELAHSLFLPSELDDSFLSLFEPTHSVNPRTELLLPSSHGLSDVGFNVLVC